MLLLEWLASITANGDQFTTTTQHKNHTTQKPHNTQIRSLTIDILSFFSLSSLFLLSFFSHIPLCAVTRIPRIWSYHPSLNISFPSHFISSSFHFLISFPDWISTFAVNFVFLFLRLCLGHIARNSAKNVATYVGFYFISFICVWESMCFWMHHFWFLVVSLQVFRFLLMFLISSVRIWFFISFADRSRHDRNLW